VVVWALPFLFFVCNSLSIVLSLMVFSYMRMVDFVFAFVGRISLNVFACVREISLNMPHLVT